MSQKDIGFDKSRGMKYLLSITCCLMLTIQGLIAQELLCNISVNASQVQSDRQIYQEMQKTLSEYVNFRSWTDDKFETQERIRATIQIRIQNRPTADKFEGQATIQVYRPVYNSTYETLLLNFDDLNFDFNYTPFQQLEYVENQFKDNLTAMINFYVYLILGFDYASFSNGGGGQYFQKALQIANLAQGQANEPGWQSGGDQRNRFWLIENLTNSRYKRFHELMFTYHRKGLDVMESDINTGRLAILESIRFMQEINRTNPLLIINRVFAQAKDKELIKIFQKAQPAQKQEFVKLMTEIDPSNASNYNRVIEGN